jgi:hypothetical protein
VYSYFFFTTDADISYSITGLFDTLGKPQAYAFWSLWEVAGDSKYEEYEYTTIPEDGKFSPDENVISGTGYNGDATGHTSGTLGAGTYGFYFFYGLSELTADTTAETNPAPEFDSFAQLDLNAPVPEPTSLVLWSGLGVMGLIAARRRRRRAA